MYYFLLIIGILTFLFGIVPLIFSYRFKTYVKETLNTSIAEYTPKVSLILPCKGIDPGFEKNISALLQQDHPDYEVVFVTATADDPAYTFLDKLLRSTSGVPAKLIIAGISPVRGQKINNILEALKHVRVESEVFAFVDSDIRPKKSFLRNLVKPLQHPHVGATTGIRW